MDEFLTHNEENELVYDDCSKEFYSITNKNQCVFKGRWLPNDMVPVGLCCAHELTERGLVDFVDTILEVVVENNEGNDDNLFLGSIEDCSLVVFASGWALRAGCSKIHGAKYIENAYQMLTSCTLVVTLIKGLK